MNIEDILEIGETAAVEFSGCENGIQNDVCETVCAFLNRFGGDIYCGVLENGTVVGVPEKAASDMVRNFVKMISDQNVIAPAVCLYPKIMTVNGKTVIKIHVPQSGEVHSFKNTVYERVWDSDVKVTSADAITEMHIRKQNIFTEKKVYKYVNRDDLRIDLLQLCRKRAVNLFPGHPWGKMDDDELLRSTGLISRDAFTGETGFNLAAVMLLGRDEVIQSICPAYKTDALLRRVNTDRYDDREIVSTNLIESFDQLMDFGRKWLPDKFYLDEEMRNRSLRGAILKEMISNVLIHREFSSSYQVRFVIESERMVTENACRERFQGSITPENAEVCPKNPIIANFFHTMDIGIADVPGSGTRNLFKYTRRYSGKDPEILEDDIFRIIVPLDDTYSYDVNVFR